MSGVAERRRTGFCPSEPCSAPLSADPKTELATPLWAGDLFNQLDLGAVRSFEEANPTAVVGRHLFEDPHPVFPQLGHGPGIIVGIERDVLDTVMLLVILRRDQCRDIEGQPV